jgi:hypothetical protein
MLTGFSLAESHSRPGSFFYPVNSPGAVGKGFENFPKAYFLTPADYSIFIHLLRFLIL